MDRAAGSRPADDETERRYWVSVSLARGDDAALLTLASALHRRGVSVLAAELTYPVEDHRTFEALIVATPRQARTVEATLRGLVPVTGATVVTDDDLSRYQGGRLAG